MTFSTDAHDSLQKRYERLNSDFDNFCELTERAAEKLKDLADHLPVTEGPKKSDCPEGIAKTLYAQKKKQERDLERRLERAEEYLQTLDAMIDVYHRNGIVLQKQGTWIQTEETRAKFDEARRITGVGIGQLEQQKKKLTQLADRMKRVLRKSRSKKLPGQESRSEDSPDDVGPGTGGVLGGILTGGSPSGHGEPSRPPLPPPPPVTSPPGPSGDGGFGPELEGLLRYGPQGPTPPAPSGQPAPAGTTPGGYGA